MIDACRWPGRCFCLLSVCVKARKWTWSNLRENQSLGKIDSLHQSNSFLPVQRPGAACSAFPEKCLEGRGSRKPQIGKKTPVMT
ncbi:hypothetical protein [Herbaspirillum sp. CF444]|uniref:hypothetical protein n=1 Tax=Herbaspirillum sp. CF444 TaxID=1144319 RepID=UPI0012FBA2EB|nr:hypothetical protein [Herbaspirillum sp. CF444]